MILKKRTDMFRQDKITAIKNNKKPIVVLLSLFLAVCTTIVFNSDFVTAEEINPTVGLEAKLLLTALTYDKNLKKDTVKELIIGLLCFPEDESSEKQAGDFGKALEKYKDMTVKGMKFKTVLFDYNSPGQLKDKIKSEKINVLYISSCTRDMVSNVAKVAKSAKVLTYSSSGDYVTDCGVSMAIVFKKNKPKIYLNISSAKAEGRNFGAKFIRIVNLVKK